MNNFFLKYLAVFFILTLSACSYKPIFSESNYNFEINEIIFSGERYINRIIKNKLDLIKNEKDQNKGYGSHNWRWNYRKYPKDLECEPNGKYQYEYLGNESNF